ncbi:hypothetical protein B0I35DRAFT_99408 [Stachybotrys elegans]|uniref:CFEM domain-containing protein n=1 Tax=Stachybotrys elegans TaxID=80388 RepID=A0A8K0SI13_9HYPO|nr:hypothetical protein B0I35DRAFT_99408 [Stachybotrys elegans]
MDGVFSSTSLVCRYGSHVAGARADNSHPLASSFSPSLSVCVQTGSPFPRGLPRGERLLFLADLHIGGSSYPSVITPLPSPGIVEKYLDPLNPRFSVPWIFSGVGVLTKSFDGYSFLLRSLPCLFKNHAIMKLGYVSFLTVLLAGSVFGQDDLMAALPACAVDCFAQTITASTCADPTDFACLCIDQPFMLAMQGCQAVNCTIKETLSASLVLVSTPVLF